METILDRIIDDKRKEIIHLKELTVGEIGEIKKQRSFIGKLKKAEEMCIISEFKRASPSKGIINVDMDPVKQAIQYEEYGASAISVLCDSHFKGSLEDLKTVRKAVNLPILCKDFIVERKQISHAKVAGADLILLIASVLDKATLKELYDYTVQLGLEALVEIHDEAELDRALAIGAELIGINNRDLRNFDVRLETTERLGKIVRESGALLISESGIKTKEDVVRVAKAGANGILVGETFMSTANLRQSFKDFKIPLKGVIQQ
ncbi:indole-3-glycerol phosphate synthase TrpC [Bacillus sp. B15-48]|uniref:indole-3-glycerol phosphate synthase TrpC n=1 Tax=Bacillus sp. B15-48 TaxID=1548601 RepID=UPI00193F89CC|nr:indole-3-glycerol phosphate synthase TrpC [Bacillus sp. B15-48]